MAGRKFQIGNAFFVNRKKGLFLFVYVDDIQSGLQALVLSSLSTRNGSPFGHFVGRNGPHWEVRGIENSTPDRRGTLISIPFLGLSLLFLGSKYIKVGAFEKPD